MLSHATGALAPQSQLSDIRSLRFAIELMACLSEEGFSEISTLVQQVKEHHDDPIVVAAAALAIAKKAALIQGCIRDEARTALGFDPVGGAQ